MSRNDRVGYAGLVIVNIALFLLVHGSVTRMEYFFIVVTTMLGYYYYKKPII
jgi:hypothetical protein